MLIAKKESRRAFFAIFFICAYTCYLFLFRTLLLRLDNASNSILKPEPVQIAVLALFLLLYYFTYLGLSFFSDLGIVQKTTAIVIAIVVHTTVLYGLLLWYEAIVQNHLLFNTVSAHLPLYAQEQEKFFIANSPLILFCLTIFVLRLTEMLRTSHQTGLNR